MMKTEEYRGYFNMMYNSYSPSDTEKIAADFARTLKPSDVICLRGDLGAGKTSFVQGLVKGLGVTEPISSPTFTIVNCYTGGIMPIYHFDVYRIEDSDEMYEIGFEEYLDGGGVTIIEWPDNIADILPDNVYNITVSKDYDKDESFRYIEIDTVCRDD